jgi:Glutamine amidotransferases class-II
VAARKILAMVPVKNVYLYHALKILAVLKRFFLGILVGMPDAYYRRVMGEQNIKLGPINSYGTGIVFAPQNDAAVNAMKEIFQVQAQQRGLKVIGWRSIKTGGFLFLFRNLNF